MAYPACFEDRRALSIDDIPDDLLESADAGLSKAQNLPEQKAPHTKELAYWGMTGWEEVDPAVFNVFDAEPKAQEQGTQLPLFVRSSGDLPMAPIKPIGRVANTGYSRASDIKDIADFMNIIHRGRSGVRVIGRKHQGGKFFTQGFRFWSGIAGIGIQRDMKGYVGQNDIYYAANLMFNKRKGNNNIKRLMALYVDLDCYHIGLTPEQAYEVVRTQYSFIRIPVPSIAVKSGRGLQLIWLIDEDPNAISRWETVEKWLCEQLAALEADPKTTDPSRYLRMPFTHNSKGGDTAILDFVDVSYTLREIISAYDLSGKSSKKKTPKNPSAHPYGEATEKMRKAAMSIAGRLGLPCPNFESYDETSRFIGEGLEKIKQPRGEAPVKEKKQSGKLRKAKRGCFGEMNPAQVRALTDARVEDLKILATMRKGIDCGREYILFLVRYFTAEATRDYDYALRTCLEANQLFECPLDESEVIKATASAEKILRREGRYKYSNAKIIKVLQITPEELRHLHYLCPIACAERKKEWDRDRKKKAYYEDLEKTGSLPASEKISRKVNALAEMSAKGLARDDICAELKISEATFYRYKKMAEGMAKEIAPEKKADIEEKGTINNTAEAKAQVGGETGNKEASDPYSMVLNEMRAGYRKTSLFPLAVKGNIVSQANILIFSPQSIITAPRRGAASPRVSSRLGKEGACANIRAACTGSWSSLHEGKKTRKVVSTPNLAFPHRQEECVQRGGRRPIAAEESSLRLTVGRQVHRSAGWKSAGSPDWVAFARGSPGVNKPARAGSRGSPDALLSGFGSCWGNTPLVSSDAWDEPPVWAGEAPGPPRRKGCGPPGTAKDCRKFGPAHRKRKLRPAA